MLIFEMRDPTPIEAIVISTDYDRASEMFSQHLRAQGGDPNTLLYRKLELKHLEPRSRKAVRKALGLAIEGLVICDAAGQWAFVMPLGEP